MKIINHLNEFRTKHNLTLRELATLSGLSRNYLDRIENGMQYPRINEVYRLVEILETTVENLFERIE